MKSVTAAHHRDEFSQSLWLHWCEVRAHIIEAYYIPVRMSSCYYLSELTPQQNTRFFNVSHFGKFWNFSSHVVLTSVLYSIFAFHWYCRDCLSVCRLLSQSDSVYTLALESEKGPGGFSLQYYLQIVNKLSLSMRPWERFKFWETSVAVCCFSA